MDGTAPRDAVRDADRDRGELADVLVSLVVSGIIGLFVVLTFGVTLRATSATSQRVNESNDAQILTDAIAADVNGMVELTADECGSASGLTRLVGVDRVDDSRVVYYADATARQIVRRTCLDDGSGVQSRTLVRELAATTPAVTCDDGACVAGDVPDTIRMLVTESSGFEFALVGSRRYDPGGGGAAGSWTFVILGTTDKTVTASGGSSLTVNGDAHIASTHPAWYSGGPTNMTVTGSTIQGPIPDPLAALPVPAGGSLPVYTDGKYHGPGVYRGKTLAVSSPIVMAPGTYIVEKGFVVSGGGGAVGDGVFLYNGCAADAPAGCKSDGPFTVSGSGSIDLSAPASGTYAGVLLFHARDNTKDVTLSGSAVGTALEGIMYAPSAAKFTMGSGGAALLIGGIIANKVVTSGSGVIQVGAP